MLESGHSVPHSCEQVSFDSLNAPPEMLPMIPRERIIKKRIVIRQAGPLRRSPPTRDSAGFQLRPPQTATTSVGNHKIDMRPSFRNRKKSIMTPNSPNNQTTVKFNEDLRAATSMDD